MSKGKKKKIKLRILAALEGKGPLSTNKGKIENSVGIGAGKLRNL